MHVPGDGILKVHVLTQISNLDVTVMNLNGFKSQRGDRPSISFINGWRPPIGLGAKTSQSTSMII